MNWNKITAGLQHAALVGAGVAVANLEQVGWSGNFGPYAFIAAGVLGIVATGIEKEIEKEDAKK